MLGTLDDSGDAFDTSGYRGRGRGLDRAPWKRLRLGQRGLGDRRVTEEADKWLD